MGKFSDQSSNLPPQDLVKEEQNKSTACRKEEGIEIKAEVNEIENKNNREKSMKKKADSLKRSLKLTNL